MPLYRDMTPAEIAARDGVPEEKSNSDVSNALAQSNRRVKSNSYTPLSKEFDKRTYQREYMRKRREEFVRSRRVARKSGHEPESKSNGRDERTW